jgi:cytochrome c-type biogenesis protein CcmH
MLFWIICIILIGIALAFIVPALLQSGEEQLNDDKQANVGVYRDQISELEADLQNGIVSSEQYQHDREEIERRLLEDVASPEDVPKNVKRIGGRRLAYVVAMGIPVIAVALYLRIGNPAAISASTTGLSQVPTAGSQPANPMTQQGIDANVAALAKRLEANPNDAEGWVMLGRSYLNLKRYSEATGAYAKATALKPDNADLFADYAFAMGMANGQRLQGEPHALINKALQLDPENPKALELAGSAAFEARNYKDAISYWERLLARTPANSELAAALTERINRAKSLAGL